MTSQVLLESYGFQKDSWTSNYRPTPHKGHLSTITTHVSPGRQSITCFLFKSLCNCQLSAKATATKACPQLPVFSATDNEKVKNGHEIWSIWHFDDSRGNRILIVFHLYCYSKQKLSMILFAKPCSFWYIHILIQNILIKNTTQLCGVFCFYIIWLKCLCWNVQI